MAINTACAKTRYTLRKNSPHLKGPTQLARKLAALKEPTQLAQKLAALKEPTQLAQKLAALKGHDFSRAAKARMMKVGL